METKRNNADDRLKANCNVNSTFNFLVGGIAIAAAMLIGYLAYVYWWK